MADILSTVANVLSPAAGVASPVQIYAEAVPRAERIMKQYDTAAPLIDWVEKYPVVTLGLLVVLGSIAVIGGNFLYDAITERR